MRTRKTLAARSLSAVRGLPDALGESEAFLEFQAQLSRVAKIDRPVLILGERGTGKELAAARLHYLSGRWRGPLVALNCGALMPSLLETELFGHEANAFTGAGLRRQGRFEAADDGTLLLDEIGLIPMPVQEKILRVVEYGAFERVGSSTPIQVNVRILAATNADLPEMARQGRFKVDLLDRLSFEALHVPPLRERIGDILLLARHFAARMAMEMGRRESPDFSHDVIQAMEHHGWPGNVRELKNTVERAVYRCNGPVVTSIDFNPFTGPSDRPQTAPPSAESMPMAGYKIGASSLPEAVRQLEVTALRAALIRSRHHQGAAARLLGITYHQFRALYRKHRARLNAGLATPDAPDSRPNSE